MANRWVEISTRCERERYQALSQTLKMAGVENSLDFIEIKPEEFESELRKAFETYDQIRVGGELRDLVPSLITNFPTSLLTLKSADAMVKEQGVWWPRNYLSQGIQHAIVSSGVILDFKGAVFIFGVGGDTRSAIAALVRLGFQKFTISDPHDAVGEEFVEELRRSYFLVQFQIVPRHMVTQLPNTHSFAVNTVEARDDESSENGPLAELYYFNFLKPGGVWLDLPLAAANAALEAEARAVSAFVASAVQVAVCTDQAWAESCWGVKIDGEAYASQLAALKNELQKTPE